jgi:hypothetical protein
MPDGTSRRYGCASVCAVSDMRLERYAKLLVWAAPAWAVLLFVGTLEHQPSPTTAFPEYARFITTTPFLISHLVASILGAAFGTLGFAALFVLLVGTLSITPGKR